MATWSLATVRRDAALGLVEEALNLLVQPERRVVDGAARHTGAPVRVGDRWFDWRPDHDPDLAGSNQLRALPHDHLGAGNSDGQNRHTRAAGDVGSAFEQLLHLLSRLPSSL